MSMWSQQCARCLVGAVLALSGIQAQAQLTCPAGTTSKVVSEGFSTSSLNTTLWQTSVIAGPYAPAINSAQGRLRLTTNTSALDQATMAVLLKRFPTNGNKLVIQFDYSAYDQGGARGLAVVLSDASVTPASQYGGNSHISGGLGYAQQGGNGFAGGWLGIGLDVSGRFSLQPAGSNRTGYPTGWTDPKGSNISTADSTSFTNTVGVRGSGSGSSGYFLLSNSRSFMPRIYTNNTTGGVVRIRITIDNTSGTQTLVSVDRVSGGVVAANLIPSFNVRGANTASQQAAEPSDWVVSFLGTSAQTTGPRNTVHEFDNLEICSTKAPTDLAPFALSTAAAAFAVLEPDINKPWVAAARRPLFTKVAGTGFALDVAALNTSGSLETSYVAAGNPNKTVLVELFDSSTPVACTAYANPVASQIGTFASSSNGRITLAPLTVNSAYPKLIARVRECSNSTCTVFTGVAACSSDEFAVRPEQFELTTPVQTNAGLTGTPSAKAGTAFTLNATTAAGGYTGTPTIVLGNVVDHKGAPIAAGALTGAFAPGTGTQASGSNFQYLDVGSIRFNADAVVDSGFTAVDHNNTDCIVGSISNTLSGGKYGCNIGSAQSNTMGRWYPSHYSFTGSLTPACTAGGFTYMDQDALGVDLRIRAHAQVGASPSATDPVASRYTNELAGLATATVTLSGDNTGTQSSAVSVDLARLSSPAWPNTPQWNAGQILLQDTFAFSKGANPDGPFDDFRILARLGNAATNADADGSTWLDGANSINSTNTTRVRFGRLRMTSVYGSERLPLPVQLEAQVWNGRIFVTHTADSCTQLAADSVVMSNYLYKNTTKNTANSGACRSVLSAPSPTQPNTLVAGKLSGVSLSPPGRGFEGSVRLSMQLGATATANDKTCLSTTQTPATAANLPWLGESPRATYTFGIYKSPLTDLRENY